MTKHVYAVDNLVLFLVALSDRADYGYFVAGLLECRRLLPHATVKGDGKIFDNY